MADAEAARGELLLTVFLEHRQSMNLAEIIDSCSNRSPLRSGAAA